MASTTLSDEVAQLSDALADTEARISELRDQLRGFTEPVEAGCTPTALPPDFDPVSAQTELNELLKKRHVDNARYRALVDQQKAAQEAEKKQALAALQARYKESVVRLLQCAVAFAFAVRDADHIRSEAFDLLGHWAGLPFIGPSLGHWNLWNLKDRTSPLSFWLRESKSCGYIRGDESWLENVVF